MTLLDELNKKYAKLHTAYELMFWDVYMLGPGKSEKMNKALEKRDAFRADKKLAARVDEALKEAKGVEKQRLSHWKNFFSLFQMPEHVAKIKEEAHAIETEIAKIRQTRIEGYTDPKTGKFVEASENKMRSMMRTNPDESIRKAVFDALEQLPLTTIDLFVKLIAKRNEFAHALGYDNFYAYKLYLDELMTLDELFVVFDKVYSKTKNVFKIIKDMELEKPGITKPWNFSFMTSGDFTKEEDPYYPLDKGLIRWGQSFSALGADFAGGTVVLDMIDRKGKSNNGFCHWPRTVRYEDNKRIPGEARMSCNAVIGEIGQGFGGGHHTLFHEGGHACHYLNSEQRDVILNHEYPPSSVSWAETQSMFMDTVLNSIEWKTRYAEYPFELFEKKVKKLGFLAPLGMMSINAIMELERAYYEEETLTKEKLLNIAKNTFIKFSGFDTPSLRFLNVNHIYHWDSSGYYHGYGLAELQVYQWREYFYKKYGYIVDNPNVGKEMKKLWKLAASRPSKDFIKLATGEKINPDAYIRSVSMTCEQKIALAHERVARMERVKRYTKPVRLNGVIILKHGKKKIADSKQGFERMAEKYKKWLNTQK